MGPNYPILDALAQNNIINFDADAFIYGAPPRYGVPVSVGDRPLMTSPNMSYPQPYQPHNDVFTHHNEEESRKFSIKGILLGLILSGVGIFAGFKFKDKILPKIPGTAANKVKKVAEDAKIAAQETAKQAEKTGFTAFLKKNWKIGAIGAGSIAGLYFTYKIISKIFGHRGIQGQVPNPTLPNHHKLDERLELMTPGSKTPEP